MPPPMSRSVDLGEVRLRIVEAGDPHGPLVVLAHGFPELAYSWRHQVPALAAAGFHVVAPDQRGYGGSSRPDAVESYDIHALTGDIVALIDHGGAARAAVVGHDWGAMVAWHTALLHPDRVAAVAGLSVPPVPRARSRPTLAWRRAFGEDFYMLRFQEEGRADAELAADPAATMRAMFTDLPAVLTGEIGAVAAGPLPGWITDDDIDHYATEFARTGFTGGLNWYRNYDRNWETTGGLDDATVAAPSLFVVGGADPLLGFARLDRAAAMVTGPYRQVIIDGAGHWLQQEAPAEVNAALLDFLTGVGPW